MWCLVHDSDNSLVILQSVLSPLLWIGTVIDIFHCCGSNIWSFVLEFGPFLVVFILQLFMGTLSLMVKWFVQ